MKTFNKDEQKAVATDIFKRYTKAQKVSVTSDGMAFITDEGENAVKNHSKNNLHGKELAITAFTRDEVESNSALKSKTAKEVIQEIEAATEGAVVEAILTAENAGEKRKTVLDAGAKKLEELKKPE